MLQYGVVAASFRVFFEELYFHIVSSVFSVTKWGARDLGSLPFFEASWISLYTSICEHLFVSSVLYHIGCINGGIYWLISYDNVIEGKLWIPRKLDVC